MSTHRAWLATTQLITYFNQAFEKKYLYAGHLTRPSYDV